MTGTPELRGDCREIAKCVEHEAILSGPRDTGKTFACCFVLNCYASMVPNCQITMVRKVQRSMAGTVLRSFERVIAGQGVRRIGGENPVKYIYPNGSTVWIAGMDNPGKVLSSERDVIYVNQAEELGESDWEFLAGCCSGRGAVVANPQILGDCNPGGSRHWIRKRSKEGKLRLLVAKHQDNPDLYTVDGVVTEEGKKRLAVLESYTGVRRKRMLLGIWATAEGAVFEEFDPSIHVLERDPKEMQRWFLAIDEGYTNPCALLLVGQDGDGRQHLFREFYHRNKLQLLVVNQAREWYIPSEEQQKLGYRHCELAAVDDAAAGLIADLRDAGINAVGGKGRILDGITKLQGRMVKAGDGRPRFTLDPSCVETINEFESHVWTPDKPKDVPLDTDNHAIAALRYLSDVLGEHVGAWDSHTIKQVTVAPQTPGLPAPRQFVPRQFVPRKL